MYKHKENLKYRREKRRENTVHPMHSVFSVCAKAEATIQHSLIVSRCLSVTPTARHRYLRFITVPHFSPKKYVFISTEIFIGDCFNES